MSNRSTGPSSFIRSLFTCGFNARLLTAIIIISIFCGLLILFHADIFNHLSLIQLPGYVYLYLAAALCLSFIFISFKKDKDFFSPSVFFPLYYFVWMILGATLRYFSRGFLESSHEAYIPFLIITGLLFFIIGQVAATSVINLFKPIFKKSGSFGPGYTISKEKISIFLISAIVLGGYFYLKNFNALYFSSEGIETARITVMFGQGFVYNFVMSMYYVLPLYIGIIWVYDRRINFIDMCIILLGSLIIFAPLNRGPILWMLIYIIFLRNYIKKRVDIKSLLVFFVFLFAAGIVIAMIRSSKPFFLLIFDELQVHCYNLSLYLKHVSTIGPPLGLKPYLMSFEMLLPGHQPDFVLWLKDILGLEFLGGGASVTLIGELYLAGRMLYVALGFAIIGFLSRYVYLLFRYKRTAKLLAAHMIITCEFCSAITFGLHKMLLYMIWILILIVIFYPGSYVLRNMKAYEDTAD